MRNLPTKWLVGAGLVVVLLLAGVASYYASSSPDALNRVAADKGFAHTHTQHAAAEGPLAGYEVSGVDHARLSGGLAGVTGVLVVLVLATGLAFALRRRSPEPVPAPESVRSGA